MTRNHLKGLDKKRLRRWLLIFFLSLAIPTAVLVQQSYTRLKWETFHQHQLMAGELTRRINQHLIKLIHTEEQRPFTDYAFLNVAGTPEANFLQRSPLSRYPVQSEIPGLIGYFQVDAEGRLVTPMLPEDMEKAASYGIAEPDLSTRAALQNRIQQILSANRLVRNQHDLAGKNERTHPAKRPDKALLGSKNDRVSPGKSMVGDQPLKSAAPSTSEGQAAFDALNMASSEKGRQENKLGRIEDLQFRKTFQKETAEPKPSEAKEKAIGATAKKARTEQTVLPESIQRTDPASAYALEEDRDETASPARPEPKSLRIRTFESAIDPFEFSQLDSGHFVLFRKVWLNGQRYIQGLLIEQGAFLQGNINAAFRETTLSQVSDLVVVFQGNILSAFAGRTPRGYLSSADELKGELLYQDHLSEPFSELQFVYSITQLPVGPGGWIIIWLTAVLAIVFLAGFYVMYRFGVGQINLVNQQQDFVSAVSHELKTPLTSIRMYGEMLQAGWVDEARKKIYYDFILDESERLTRLINNVLQLAKLTRNEKKPELRSVTVAELWESVQSKISTPIEREGFHLTLSCDQDAAQARIRVNPDWFVQIMINLVDNAIKFSAKADTKMIELSCQRSSGAGIQFKIRDYGPGIDKGQLKKIFQLFYRSENELTRETVGTGIGLALAHQMTVGMSGEIDAANREPGAEFRLYFPIDQSPQTIPISHNR